MNLPLLPRIRCLLSACFGSGLLIATLLTGGRLLADDVDPPPVPNPPPPVAPAIAPSITPDEAIEPTQLRTEGLETTDPTDGPAKTKKKTSKRKPRTKSDAEADKPQDVVGPGENRHLLAADSIDELHVVMGRATIDGRILGDLSVVGGKVTVNGTVDGSIRGVGCRLVLGSNAVVRGDLSGFGKLEKRRGALIQGKQEWRSGVAWRDVVTQPPNEWLNNLDPKAQVFMGDHVLKGRPLSGKLIWPWIVLLGIGLVHVGALWLFPQYITRTAHLLGARPVTTLALGFVSLPILIVAGLALSFVTGCLGTPFVVLALMLGLVVGKVAVELQLGRRLMSWFRLSPAPTGTDLSPSDPTTEPVWVPYLIGSVLLVFTYIVPFVGFGIWAVFSLWGLGAALLLLYKRSSFSGPEGVPAATGPQFTPPNVPPMNPVHGTQMAATSADFVVNVATPAPVTVDVAPEVLRPSPAGFVALDSTRPLMLSSRDLPTADSIPLPVLGETSPTFDPTSAIIPATPSEQPTHSAPELAMSAAVGIPIPPPPPLPSVAPEIHPTGVTEPTPPSASASRPERDLWSLPRVGFRLRFLALLVDLLIYGIAMVVLPGRLTDIPFAMAVLCVGYFAGCWVWKGASIGGLLTGIRLIRLDGRRIDWQVSLVRSLASFLSLFSAGLGELWCVWDPDQQTWQDKLAGTVVVREERLRSLI